ncbi:MAG: hypothetical protein EOP48_34725 [Sphingobacteriales bacterium]|nr:MAG: hypothetical protein EOP48_34725 [Sphingobacteriales bacterium]
MAVELELKLSLGEHKTDFEKLLAANAENCLFVCQAYTDDIESRLEFFQKGINLYDKSRTDDNFLIVIFDYYTHKISYRKLTKEYSV